LVGASQSSIIHLFFQIGKLEPKHFLLPIHYHVMASAAIDAVGGVIGLTDSGISLIGGFFDTLFPSPPEESFNNFRVFVGETRAEDNEADSRSLGGNAPALAIWRPNGKFLNQLTPDGPSAPKIGTGGFRDYAIEGREGADYLSVVRTGNDGICIYLITGQTAGTGLSFIWTGDVAKACGAPWYQSRKAAADGYFPSCIWIDGNADGNHVWTGPNVHLGSFSDSNTGADKGAAIQNLTANAWKANRDLLCKSEPRFSMYKDIEIGNQIRTFIDDPSTGGEPGTQGYRDMVLGQDNWGWGEKPPTALLPKSLDGRTPKIQCVEEDCPPKGPSFSENLPEQVNQNRRSMRGRHKRQAIDSTHAAIAEIKKRQAIRADRLVITNIPQHSVIELCNSEYSLGPDMVSTTEGMFCDMSEKQLWPVCSDASALYCFDMESQIVRGSDTGGATTNAPLYPNATTPVSLVAGGSAAGNPTVPIKSYTKVSTWDP
jgi:hypothetical protein